jgi:glycosyltransferase involved in cell wall biosynthesis
MPSYSCGVTVSGDAAPLLARYVAPADGAGTATASGREGAILFITDEVFLPQTNGSGSVYANVARRYREAGHAVHCLSFYRDGQQAGRAATRAAYQELFDDFLFLPGWNRGGGVLGYAGMGWREMSRWATGNVFASHPLLCASQASIADRVLSFVSRNRIDVIYFHKPHTLLLCEPILPRLWAQRCIVDLHDDFVARDAEYAAAYASVFRALPWRSIVRQFGAMYLRHRFTHTDRLRSRRRELSLLLHCDEVRVASEQEYAAYASVAELAGRVRHQPWPCAPAGPMRSRAGRQAFHAGFIGADNVMNLDAVLHLRDDILPRVRARRPDFRMLLAGTMTRKTADLLRCVPGIETWGRLDDVATFYDAVRVAAVPIRHGTGVSVKAIEALAYGSPLVTTSMGVRGQPAATLLGHNVTIADNPAAFAEALLLQAFGAVTNDAWGNAAGGWADAPYGAARGDALDDLSPASNQPSRNQQSSGRDGHSLASPCHPPITFGV